METLGIDGIKLRINKPKNKNKNEEGGWLEKNDGKYIWVEGPGKWVEKNDGSGFYTWVPIRR